MTVGLPDKKSINDINIDEKAIDKIIKITEETIKVTTPIKTAPDATVPIVKITEGTIKVTTPIKTAPETTVPIVKITEKEDECKEEEVISGTKTDETIIKIQ